MLEKRAKEIGAAKRRKTVMGACSKAHIGCLAREGHAESAERSDAGAKRRRSSASEYLAEAPRRGCGRAEEASGNSAAKFLATRLPTQLDKMLSYNLCADILPLIPFGGTQWHHQTIAHAALSGTAVLPLMA